MKTPKINYNKRLRSIPFWFGVVALFLATTKIEPQTLTSWSLLKEALINFISNPYLICCFIVALVGQINDPTTPGLSDGEHKI